MDIPLHGFLYRLHFPLGQIRGKQYLLFLPTSRKFKPIIDTYPEISIVSPEFLQRSLKNAWRTSPNRWKHPCSTLPRKSPESPLIRPSHQPKILCQNLLDTQLRFLYIQPTRKRVLINSISIQSYPPFWFLWQWSPFHFSGIMTSIKPDWKKYWQNWPVGKPLMPRWFPEWISGIRLTSLGKGKYNGSNVY